MKEELEVEINLVVEWIKSQVNLLGREKVILELDYTDPNSLATIALCIKALGEENVDCISFKSSNVDLKDIDKIVSGLKIRSLTHIDLFKLTGAFASIGVGDNHLQKRLKSVILNTLGNINTYVVVGNLNKTLYSSGVFVKHADNGVDLEPLKEFYSNEVIEILEILEVKVNPDYLEMYKDNCSIIDSILKSIFEGEVLPSNISKETIQTIMQNIGSSEHKRSIPSYYERDLLGGENYRSIPSYFDKEVLG